MRFIRRGNRDNPNAFIYFALIILLIVFAGPAVLPTAIPSIIPFLNEGISCARLQTGTGRAYHQSLIARSVTTQAGQAPISLAARVRNSGDSVVYTIVVYNRTLGTVPIVVRPDDLALGANSLQDGLGIMAGAGTAPNLPNVGAVVVPEGSIRLLGPRQRCIHQVRYSVSSVPPELAIPNNLVRAFYRGNTTGQAEQRINSTQPVVFNTQGLWVGTTLSDVTTITGGASQP